MCRKRTCSFDDIVRERQDLGWKVNARRAGCFQVDNQFELCRLHNGKIGRRVAARRSAKPACSPALITPITGIGLLRAR